MQEEDEEEDEEKGESPTGATESGMCRTVPFLSGWCSGSCCFPLPPLLLLLPLADFLLSGLWARLTAGVLLLRLLLMPTRAGASFSARA